MGAARTDLLSVRASHSGPSAIHGSRTSMTPHKPSPNPIYQDTAPLYPQPPPFPPNALSTAPQRAQRSASLIPQSPKALFSLFDCGGGLGAGVCWAVLGALRRFWSHGWRKDRSTEMCRDRKSRRTAPQYSPTHACTQEHHNNRRGKKVGQADDAHTEGNVPLLPSSPGGVSAPVSHRAWPIMPIGRVLR